ncbi:hypothetical protein [Nostoc sp. NMS8]|nr:hypothetical protein [Nostoc sp. NMS8]
MRSQRHEFSILQRNFRRGDAYGGKLRSTQGKNTRTFSSFSVV